MSELENDWTSLPLVENMDQLSTTVKTLFSYYKTNGFQKEFYLGLLKRGTCFLVCTVQGEEFFAPSKFIGYFGNTIDLHTPGKMTGIDTNNAIHTILNERPVVNPGTDEKYKKFCIAQGFSPRLTGTAGAPRKYWSTIIEIK